MDDPDRRTPPLSPEGIAEILTKPESPPLDTPERRATFERMRFMAEAHRQSAVLEETAAKMP